MSLALARAGLLLFVVLLWELLWIRGLPAYILGPFEILKHFFAALGSPILAGRDFNDGDRRGVDSVVIISQSLARRMLGSHGEAEDMV